MIRTLVFDMGNVLVGFSHARMCHQIGNVCGVGGEVISELLFERGWQMDLERGILTHDDFATRLETALGSRVNVENLRWAASDIFWPMIGMAELLDKLKQSGYRLVLLSNTSRAHYDDIVSRWDILKPFDEQILSFAAGAMKPDDAIFELALCVISCDPAEAFYTDDIADNVAAGRRHGLDAEIFVDVPTLQGHLESRGVLL